MVAGIGTDIIQISRIAATLDRLGQRFAERILTPAEMQRFLGVKDKPRYLAKRFAAKEAAGKALQTGIGDGVSWQHIEIGNDERGAPLLRFSGRAEELSRSRGIKDSHISISDELDTAIAFVVLSK